MDRRLILHVTDCHLLANRGENFLGVDTHKNFAAVLHYVKNVEKVAPDLIVLGGDLIQHDAKHNEEDYLAVYADVAERLKVFDCPVTCTFGNHDIPDIANKVFADFPNMSLGDFNALGNWNIVLLNTHWENHVNGFVSDSELHRLRRVLRKVGEQNIAIFMHHQLLPIQADWLDKIRVDNSVAVLAQILTDDRIKLVVAGHVHQDTAKLHYDKWFLTTPATAFQFASNAVEFKLANDMPGCRLMILNDDGSFETKVLRLPFDPGMLPDFSVKGY
ncbi:MAG: metallophosphoesterase [Gammaproteobacteria bacterium]|nr:metallophosphoesterase [Gammaproteobacteria bacterium]